MTDNTEQPEVSTEERVMAFLASEPEDSSGNNDQQQTPDAEAPAPPVQDETPSEAQREPEAANPDADQLIRLKVDGEEREVTVEQAKLLAQQGFDYTRKMQRLAEERRAIAAEREEWERRRTIQPEAAAPSHQQHQRPTQPAGTADLDPEVAELLRPITQRYDAEIQAMRAELDQVRTARERAAAEALVGDIASEVKRLHPAVPVDLVLTQAAPNIADEDDPNTVRLKVLETARQLAARVDALTRAAVDEAMKKKTNAPPQAASRGAAGTAARPAAKSSYLTPEDLATVTAQLI